MIKNNELFNLNNDIVSTFIKKYQYPYEVLPNIHDFILEMGKSLNSEYQEIKQNVWVHKSVTLGSGVEIIGPAIVMENVSIRHNAFLRENVIISANCVVGNSCEIKNSILLDNAQVPHFNYVGDSILGFKSHLGAGVILSNLRMDNKNIVIDGVDTKLRKIGAFIGDYVQIGCNSVINPGTVIYPYTIIYPMQQVKGIIKNQKVIKNNNIEVKRI